MQNLDETLTSFTLELIGDLKALRAGKITIAEARVRAQLAREILRAVHLQLQGMKFLSDTAKTRGQLGAPEKKGAVK